MNLAYKNTRMVFIVSFLLFAFFFLWEGAVSAQETDTVNQANDEAALVPAGITPQSPFYAADRFFERVGLFLVFGRAARAERRLSLAEERLSEARVLADAGDDRAGALADEYEQTFEQATIEAELSGNENTVSRIAEQATRHSAVLDRVVERVPEEAREHVLAARDRFVDNHIAVMRTLAEKNPERAAIIFANAAEHRALAAERRADKRESAEEKKEEKADEVRERLREYGKYVDFGEEISLVARKLRTDETAVDDVIRKATARHIEVLERVREKAPEAAQQGLENALQNAERVRALRTGALSPTQVEERIMLHRQNAEQRREKAKEALETREEKPFQPRTLEINTNTSAKDARTETNQRNSVAPLQKRIENRIENRTESRVAPSTEARVAPPPTPTTPGELDRVQSSEGGTRLNPY